MSKLFPMARRRAEPEPELRSQTEDTRARLVAATLRCIARYGIAKTGLSDVAKEADCSRQTIYNHFPNLEALVFAALLDASSAFVARLKASIATESEPGDRVLESMRFCLEELPKEPLLSVVTSAEYAPFARASIFGSDATNELLRSVAAHCLAPDPALASQVDELAEVMTRLLHSMLTLDGPATRSPKQTRAFLERWLLTPLGLSASPRRSRSGARRR